MLRPTFVIDRESRIVSKHVGFAEKAVFEREVKALLVRAAFKRKRGMNLEMISGCVVESRVSPCIDCLSGVVMRI